MASKLSKSQWEARINNAGDGLYAFVKWAVDCEFGCMSYAVIECSSCGEIWSALPNNLIRGTGCPACSKNKKRTRLEQEKRIIAAGYGKYTFVRWVDENKFSVNDRCVVKCVFDGHEWEAYVNNLVNKKRGCIKCRGAESSKNLRSSERDVINEIQNASNGKFSFIRFIGGYVNCYSKAECVCNECGRLWDAHVTHLIRGKSGCAKCSKVYKRQQEEVENNLNSIDGVKFIRWDGAYKSNKSKAVMQCKNGHEWCASVNHLILNRSGCPTCYSGGFSPHNPGSLYLLRSECGQFVKVGISNKYKQRIRALISGTPFLFNVIELYHNHDGKEIARLEKEFHSKYESAGFTGFDGATEWLKFTPELLEEFRSLSR